MTNQETPNRDTSARHQPVRTCVGCGTRRPNAELIRCASHGHRVEANRTAPGRGAWLCGVECSTSARARRAMERTLRRTITPEEFELLQEQLRSVERNN